MIALSAFLATLVIASPHDQEQVVLLRNAQQAYLQSPREIRWRQLDNKDDRNQLFLSGASQAPVKLAWESDAADDAVYTITISPEDGVADSFSVTNRKDVYITNLELGRRYDWKVTDGKAAVSSSFVTASDAPRMLRADGVGNFRDLGGWETADGKKVRQNLIFRSAGLRFSSQTSGSFLKRKVMMGPRRITPEGVATLRDDFKIKTDLELRTAQETAGMVGSVLGDDVKWVKISFAAYEYIDNVIRGKEPFAKIFKVFADEKNYPILMHCSGGRDRTGTLAFLLNGLLGVKEEDLCRDWETSIFSDQGLNFNSSRIAGLIAYLNSLPGETLKDRIENYVRSCGVTDEEIAAFRAIMLDESIGVELNVLKGNNMPLVEAELDGVKCTLILDTGASHTTFDSAFVTNAFPSAVLEPVALMGRTNLKEGAPSLFGAKKLKVGAMEIPAEDAMALPLSQLSAMVGRRIDGILGMNHLAVAPFVISLSNARLTWRPIAEMVAGFDKVETAPHGGRYDLVITLPDGKKVPLLIDSGSSWTFVEATHWPVAPSAAEQLKAADVNGEAKEQIRRGVPQRVNCGIDMELSPIIAPQPGLNQIGASDLKRYDIFFNFGEIRMKEVK